jgi:biotin synthase
LPGRFAVSHLHFGGGTPTVLPAADLQVCGGREVNLRDLQALMFAAGATGTMAGNYLTTMGRPAEEDIRMIRDLGLSIREL